MGNLEIKEGSAILSLDSIVYPLEVIYSAAYVFLDRAYVLLDRNKDRRITVQLKPKGELEVGELANEFFNELINYADYSRRAEQTKKLRETILQRALITNDSSPICGDEEFDELLEDVSDEDDYLEDPEGIAIPWEDKYGNGEDENKTE